MEPIPPDTLEREADAFDAEVRRTPDIDRFCTSSAWLVPAHRSLMPPRAPWLFRGSAGWLVLARGVEPAYGHYLQPLEAMWGFASGLVGPDPAALAEEVADTLLRTRSGWNVLILSGIRREGPLFEHLVRRLAGHLDLGLGPPTTRRTASLAGGVDGFLGRRSAAFRRNLRSARRRTEGAGITFERHLRLADPEAILERSLAVERRSWKGREQVGIGGGKMEAFYRDMLPRLSRTDSLRAVFARAGDRDVAFVFGGVLGDTYRGLQMGYDAAFKALSLGTVVQLELIEALAGEGVQVYDLGQDIAYKHRWSEAGLTTVTLVAGR